MPTARKLPSGSWRCLVYDYTDANKKRHYQSFTSGDPSPSGKREAELAAIQFAMNREPESPNKELTFGQALDKYIQNRESVLSPRTIMDYKRIRRNDLQSLMDININRVTQEIIQRAINLDAETHSPKTVRNNHGLVSAVMKLYRPNFALNTALPKKVRPDIYVPSDAEIRRLMDYVSGTEMELPVLLATFGPMRRGEICALETKNINGSIVHVCQNMVLTSDHNWTIRQPKSYAGDRYISYPSFVAEKWIGMTGRITDLTPNNITDKFRYTLIGAGLKHFRFHDLRHYSASIQHALGIPDAYIMQRGGWGNDGVLKAVYRHTLSDRAEQMTDIANAHFESLCNTKCNTNKKEPCKNKALTMPQTGIEPVRSLTLAGF